MEIASQFTPRARARIFKLVTEVSKKGTVMGRGRIYGAKVLISTRRRGEWRQEMKRQFAQVIFVSRFASKSWICLRFRTEKIF